MTELTMRERVAQAICRNSVEATARSLRAKTTFAWTDNRVEVRWREYLDVADDAIEAMRYPTTAVICAVEAMAEERYHAAPDMQRWYGDEVWNAGVDAALAEKLNGD